MDKTKLAALLREAAYTIDLNDEYETNIELVKELYAAAQELVPVDPEYDEDTLAMVTYSGTVHLAVHIGGLWYVNGTAVPYSDLDSVVVVGTATLNGVAAEQMRNIYYRPAGGPWPLDAPTRP